MGALNPMQMLMMLKNGNPQYVVEQIIRNNYANDPMMQNLLQLGLNGDTKSLEQIARQMLSQNGKDFDTEMKNLMQMTKNL